MKKIAKILVACVLLMSVVFSFASCGMFNPDVDSMKDKLKDNGYEYDVQKNEDYTSISMVSYLAEIGASLSDLYNIDIDEAPVKTISAFIEGDDAEYFGAFEFEKTSYAKEAYEELEDVFENITDDSDEDISYGRKGKTVYIGTVQGVKDALGFPASLFVSAK